MIRKFLLMALSCTAISAQGDNFYLKGGVGVNMINPFKIHEDELETKAKLMHLFPLVEAGIGYDFAERIRTEMVFDYYFLFNIQETFDYETVVADFTRKVKINALFINSYINLMKFEKIDIFLGGGIGNSFQKEKVKSLSITVDSYGRDQRVNKQINQFAYKLTAGIDFRLNDNLNLETSYNYFDLGKSRQNYRYKLHNITLGLRYAL